jgi:hypothetical protein
LTSAPVNGPSSGNGIASLALRPTIFAEAMTGARVLHVDNVDEETRDCRGALGARAGLIVTTDIDQVTGSHGGARRGSDVSRSWPNVCRRRLPARATPARPCAALRQRHDGMLCVTLGPRVDAAGRGTSLLKRGVGVVYRSTPPAPATSFAAR